MRPRQRSVVLLVSALAVTGLVAGLAGCTPPSPEPAPSTVTPSESATPPPAADAGPTPRIPLACSEVIDLGALQDLVGDGGAPLQEVAPALRLVPDRAAGVQLGSIDCEWSNGAPGDPWTGPAGDAQTVQLRVLPDGLDAAAAYVALYQIADPTYGPDVQGPRCLAPASLSGNPGFCELIGVIGQSWVELHVNGIVDDAADDASLVTGFRLATDPMVAKLQTATPGPRWTPPAATAVDCEAIASGDEVAALTGLDEVYFGTIWDGPRVGQYSWTSDETAAKACRLGLANTEASFGTVSVLPGGAWAFERYADEWAEAGAAPVAVAGVADGDAMTAGCDDASATCRVELRVGGDWIRVSFPPVPSEEASYMPANDYAAARDSVLALAELVAARVAAA